MRVREGGRLRPLGKRRRSALGPGAPRRRASGAIPRDAPRLSALGRLARAARAHRCLVSRRDGRQRDGRQRRRGGEPRGPLVVSRARQRRRHPASQLPAGLGSRAALGARDGLPSAARPRRQSLGARPRRPAQGRDEEDEDPARDEPQQPDRRRVHRRGDGRRRRGRAARRRLARGRRDLPRRGGRGRDDADLLGPLRAHDRDVGSLQGFRAAGTAHRMGRGAEIRDRRDLEAPRLPDADARHAVGQARRDRDGAGAPGGASRAHARHPAAATARARRLGCAPSGRLRLDPAARRRDRLRPLPSPDRSDPARRAHPPRAVRARRPRRHARRRPRDPVRIRLRRRSPARGARARGPRARGDYRDGSGWLGDPSNSRNEGSGAASASHCAVRDRRRIATRIG